MRRLLTPPVLSALLLSLLLPAAPADAVTAGATGALTGGFSVSPGLSVLPNTHSWSGTITGMWFGVIDETPSPGLFFSCGLSWTTKVANTEHFGEGVGTGTSSCQIGMAILPSNLTVVRVGNVATLLFTKPSTLPLDQQAFTGTAVCVLIPSPAVPNGMPPASSSFQPVCVATGLSLTP